MPHHLDTFIKYYNAYGPETNKSFYVSRLENLLNGTLEMIYDQKWGGAFPDFIRFENGSYRAFTKEGVDKNLFDELGEDITPNHYSWNACRVPWRLSEYYQLTSNYYKMKLALGRLREGLMGDGSAANVAVEYDLSFNKVTTYFTPAFASPAALALKHMHVQNSGSYNFRVNNMKTNYNLLKNEFKGHSEIPEQDGYYDDSINIFSMLLITDLMPAAYKN